MKPYFLFSYRVRTPKIFGTTTEKRQKNKNKNASSLITALIENP